MITRQNSKIIDSVVNAAHEEHYNITKAIRDDAPLTSSISVVKSLNFNADGDGAYILRKPLVKYRALNALNQYLLSDKETIMTFANGMFSTSNNYSFKLTYYNENLERKEDISLTDASWITQIVSSYNTPDHTIFSVVIDHLAFKTLYTDTLVTDTWEDYPNKSIGRYLKRFIKIYPHETLADTYVIDIVHPEFNSITSGLDVGNASTLDINLLLDNPYAIRDLYGYGYVSCTKIVPYVFVEDDSNYSLSDITSKQIWELTEKGPYDNKSKGFTILASTNPLTFKQNRKFLILKAFMTTAQTNSTYYGCWEQSTDGGTTWSECPQFTSRFDVVTKTVSDITSSEFDNAIKSETIEQLSNYLVEKQMVPLSLTTDYSYLDQISTRPDVLVLENPDLSIKYRYQIYILTNKETPTPLEQTKTIFKDTFSSTSDTIEEDVPISYETNRGKAPSEATIVSNHLVLKSCRGVITHPQFVSGEDRKCFPDQASFGNSLIVKSTSEEYKIKSVTITIGPKQVDGNIVFTGGGLASSATLPPTVSGNSNSFTLMIYRECQAATSSSSSKYKDVNPYNLDYSGRLDGWRSSPPEDLEVDPGYNTKFWVSPGGAYKYTPENPQQLVITNISSWIGRNQYSATGYSKEGDSATDVMHDLYISKLTVTYTKSTQIPFTDTYMVSSTGTFSPQYANEYKTVEDVQSERTKIFTGLMFFNDNQKQMLFYKDTNVYVSGTNSAIISLMNSFVFPENITKIITWRNYLVLFSKKNIYLGKYDISSDTYNLKTLSNTVGVSKEDADTVVPILNSIYFKSGPKIYKLVPNLYAASDDNINIHPISTGINTILESIVSEYFESHNFAWADADNYSVFIPLSSEGCTFCIDYNISKQLWTVSKYPVVLTDIEKISNNVAYVKDASNLYYFRETLHNLIKNTVRDDGGESIQSSIDVIMHTLPYGDYLTKTPFELCQFVDESTGAEPEETFEDICTPFTFEIDFGQKSSNYTMDKQFLETKMILATYFSKDTFPLELEISTDGIERVLHFDANTDSAIQKQTLDETNALSTWFEAESTNYSGILRQLIVKYSGKGKSIRHRIYGTTKTLFKFYSMDVRARILPKKH